MEDMLQEPLSLLKNCYLQTSGSKALSFCQIYELRGPICYDSFMKHNKTAIFRQYGSFMTPSMGLLQMSRGAQEQLKKIYDFQIIEYEITYDIL